jgi:broad specificity phosphatase PhoE
MRITLLRHGRPGFELKGTIRARDLRGTAESYDLSGISDLPTEEVKGMVSESRQVVCSHLPRSVDSARALGFLTPHLEDPLFSETLIPHFSSGSIALPAGGWVVLLRVLWLFGFSRNGESLIDTRIRARQAAAKLIELAEGHRQVLLVGHGFMNRFIARELLRSGWAGPLKPGKGFWGYGVYEKPPT